MDMGKSPRLPHLLSRDEARGTSRMVSCKKRARRLLRYRRDDSLDIHVAIKHSRYYNE
jgi:hypothetical protein